MLIQVAHSQTRTKLQDAVHLACKHIHNLESSIISIQTKDLDICNGYFVEITPDSWSDAIDSLDFIEIFEAEARPQPSESPPSNILARLAPVMSAKEPPALARAGGLGQHAHMIIGVFIF